MDGDVGNAGRMREVDRKVLVRQCDHWDENSSEVDEVVDRGNVEESLDGARVWSDVIVEFSADEAVGAADGKNCRNKTFFDHLFTIE